MTNRELSEKLSLLGCKIEETIGRRFFPPPDSQEYEQIHEVLLGIARELHALSNENYSPHTSWAEIKKQVQSSNTKKKFYDSSNREMPF